MAKKNQVTEEIIKAALLLYIYNGNRMFGVAGVVMILPLHTRLNSLESARYFDFKGCLERSHCADIKAWGW